MILRRVLVSMFVSVVAAGGIATTASAAPSAPSAPVVDGVARDNVDMAHSPLTAEEFAATANNDVAPAADYIRGIDVSRYQHTAGPIDWAQVAGSGIRFVGIKATEGNYYQNPYFADDQNGARDAGMYAFAYHFGTPNDTGALEQADYFLDRAQYMRDGKTLYPTLDIEYNPYNTANQCYNKTQAENVAWIREFVTEVQRRTGVPALIYTSPGFWRDCTGNSTAFGANPLWISHWGVSTPTMPPGWSNWTFWQYSSTTTVPGISGNVDGNYFSGSAAALDAMAAKASGFTPSNPIRVLDTRETSALGPGGSRTLDLSSQLPATATAVVLNVTGIASTSTFVTVWPAGGTRPNASNLNLVAGEIRPNLVTVQVGPDRRITLGNQLGSTHLVVDLAGWYATDASGLYTALSPQRVLDTRDGAGPLGPNATRDLDLSAYVPASATAVTLNLTGVGATESTFVTAFPTGADARPNASNLNLANGNPTPNLVTVKLGLNRKVSLYNLTGSVDLVADLAGYYSDTGAKFVPVAPQRLLDSRNGGVSWTPVSGGGVATALTMIDAVPHGASGVIMNVTGVSPTADTYVAVYPKTSTTPPPPGASNLNLVAGQIVPNLVSVAVGSNSDVWLFNRSGSINLVADLAGYFI
ncbi:GH25 family lysozyme [Actinophytocola sp.]|uniref:GH25 family lysozyme n=1 Tax=Actinophytocola sp. TaxID=1872138 RepID=UPI002ED060C9